MLVVQYQGKYRQCNINTFGNVSGAILQRHSKKIARRTEGRKVYWIATQDFKHIYNHTKIFYLPSIWGLSYKWIKNAATYTNTVPQMSTNINEGLQNTTAVLTEKPRKNFKLERQSFFHRQASLALERILLSRSFSSLFHNRPIPQLSKYLQLIPQHSFDVSHCWTPLKYRNFDYLRCPNSRTLSAFFNQFRKIGQTVCCWITPYTGNTKKVSDYENAACGNHQCNYEFSPSQCVAYPMPKKRKRI